MTIIHDRLSKYASPRHISSALFADFTANFCLRIELPSDTPELWIQLVADLPIAAHEERAKPRVIGFMKLAREGISRPGLATYAVREIRSADAALPDQSVCRSLFELLLPEGYELLQRGQTAVPQEGPNFRPWPAEALERSPRES